MSRNKKIVFFSFAKWLAEKYILLEKKALPHAFKLNGILEKNNNQLVKIQLAGSLHEVEVDLEKILEQNLFEYFSSEDKKKLFSAAFNKERLKLSDQYFCQEIGKEIVVLTELTTGNRLALPAEDVSTNDHLISKINPKDVKRIAFLAGIEYVKRLIDSRKNMDYAR